MMKKLLPIFALFLIVQCAIAKDPYLKLTVAQDGSGDFKTIQEAVNSTRDLGPGKWRYRLLYRMMKHLPLILGFTRWLTNIDEYYDMPVGTYSQGMRARFSFSLLLAMEFDIYLIDEGMPGTTDTEFNRKAGTILRDRLERATVVVVSHQAETLEKFCRSAAVVRDGKFVMFDTLEEAKALYDYET